MGYQLWYCPEDTNLYSTDNRYQGDAGFDLVCPQDVVVPANTHSFMIDLKVKVSMQKFVIKGESQECIPISCALYSRSSMGSKTPLRLANSVGVIDAEYRGNIKIVVDNASDKDYVVKRGERLVQICQPALKPFSAVRISVLAPTVRGEQGFGSTN